MSLLGVTPSQTVGPFFAIGMTWDDGNEVVPAGTSGGFWIRGTVLDGNGDPIPDAVIETWPGTVTLGAVAIVDPAAACCAVTATDHAPAPPPASLRVTCRLTEPPSCT